MDEEGTKPRYVEDPCQQTAVLPHCDFQVQPLRLLGPSTSGVYPHILCWKVKHFHLTFPISQLGFHTRNRTICGKKERCQFCGSFGHVGELDCAKQSDIVREFLRLQIGAEKIQPRVKKIGKFEDFSHIANSKTIVRDTLSKEEKLEQKDAEKKLKERLMAKFGIKGAKEEEKAASPKPPEAQVAVFEEEVAEGDYYSPDEPDPSVFDGKDLRTAALAGVSLPLV